MPKAPLNYKGFGTFQRSFQRCYKHRNIYHEYHCPTDPESIKEFNDTEDLYFESYTMDGCREPFIDVKVPENENDEQNDKTITLTYSYVKHYDLYVETNSTGPNIYIYFIAAIDE
jgi:hypothetical protein